MNGYDIQEQIDVAGRGYKQGAGGAVIHLDGGVIEVYETIRSGGNSTSTAQVGMSFLGNGMSLPYAYGNNGAPGGTTLVWKGDPGGTMWEHVGGAYPFWGGMTFQLDPGNPGSSTDDSEWKIFDGKKSAGIGIKITGNNTTGAVTQSPSIENVSIVGSRDGERFSIGLWLAYTDGNGHAQVDNLQATSLEIRDVAIGIYSWNWQAVNNVISHGKLDARWFPVYLRRGSLNLYDTQFNVRGDQGAAIWLGDEAAYLRVENSYMEMPTQAAFLRVGDNNANYNFLGNAIIRGGRFNHQADPGGIAVVDSSDGWAGMVVVQDCDFKTSKYTDPNDAWFTAPQETVSVNNNFWDRVKQGLKPN